VTTRHIARRAGGGRDGAGAVRASLAAALGATAGRLRRGIVSHALRLTGLGLVFGVVAAMLAAGWIQEFLPPGQEARDPLAMAGAAVALAMLAGVAAWLPARRASRVDPLVALKD
jgi:ABC-type lipoprotein release transport system permease subunit